MKKLTLSILLLIFLMSCKTQQISLGLSEQKFTREHPAATRVELSIYRTVYLDNQSTEFYYFKDEKLYKMDHGFTPYGATKPVPTR
ncbi:hypothetical protein AB6735_09830 [Mucilaginibacter sp. RCC_168]|uniref:hypothetical protein n=1 Tax=Mucilaginibacter sp. RCC_168 TaxID=3239221 RepID=UPI0035238206